MELNDWELILKVVFYQEINEYICKDILMESKEKYNLVKDRY